MNDNLLQNPPLRTRKVKIPPITLFIIVKKKGAPSCTNFAIQRAMILKSRDTRLGIKIFPITAQEYRANTAIMRKQYLQHFIYQLPEATHLLFIEFLANSLSLPSWRTCKRRASHPSEWHGCAMRTLSTASGRNLPLLLVLVHIPKTE
jgi:hypothetical protein